MAATPRSPAPLSPPFGRYDNPGRAAVQATGLSALQELARAVRRQGDACRRDPRVYWYDGRCVVVYDAYPKGAAHLLAIPLSIDAGSPAELRPCHFAELEHLHRVAAAVAAHVGRTQFPAHRWQIGYHARPSLRPLHVHVMTTDLTSEAVKTRRHYLSFATAFFVKADRVLAMLRGTGRVQFTEEELAAGGRGDLHCRWCDAAAPTLPGIKDHLTRCARRP